MNQLTLAITTSYIPKKENITWFINDLVESLQFKQLNIKAFLVSKQSVLESF